MGSVAVYEIDGTIERWQEAGARLTVVRGAADAAEAVASALRLVASALSESGCPIELEDFTHETCAHVAGSGDAYPVQLYGVADLICRRALADGSPSASKGCRAGPLGRRALTSLRGS